jgi:hypothetical protein
MIPKYPQGKNAEQIVESIKEQICGIDKFVYDRDYNRYIIRLEMLLVLAVKDAMANLHEERGTYLSYVQIIKMRAITFLNRVISKE